MAEHTEEVTIESTVTSLAKALAGLAEGHHLTPQQLAQFKQAAHADQTWNPLKQKDLVPVAEILEVEGPGVEKTTHRALLPQGWEKQLSSAERVVLEDLDAHLKSAARQLIAKAESTPSAAELQPKTNSPWEKMACELLKSTLELVQRER